MPQKEKLAGKHDGKSSVRRLRFGRRHKWMIVTDMSAQVVFSSEALGAEVTFVFLLASVGGFVATKVFGIHKSLVADKTHVIPRDIVVFALMVTDAC
jgi:hypothetical protein